KNEQDRVGMVDRHTLRDAVEQCRLARTRGRDDQRALAVADRRDQIDRSANELRARLRRTSGFHEKLPLRVRRRERVELRPLGRERRIDVVDRSDFDDRRTSALIETSRRIDEVRFAKRELSDEVGRNVRVAWFGEVAVRGSADESRIARGVEPPAHLTSRDDLNRLLLVLWLLLVLSTPPPAPTLAAPPPPPGAPAPPLAAVVGARPAPAPPFRGGRGAHRPAPPPPPPPPPVANGPRLSGRPNRRCPRRRRRRRPIDSRRRSARRGAVVRTRRSSSSADCR